MHKRISVSNLKAWQENGEADVHQRSAWRAEAHASLGGVSLHLRCCFDDQMIQNLLVPQLWYSALVEAEHTPQQQSQCPCRCSLYCRIMPTSLLWTLLQQTILAFCAIYSHAPSTIAPYLIASVFISPYRGGNRNTHVSPNDSATPHNSPSSHTNTMRAPWKKWRPLAGAYQSRPA